MVHPLPQQFNRRLSTICLQHRHVQIINEEDEVFPYWWSKHTFSPDTQARAAMKWWVYKYTVVL